LMFATVHGRTDNPSRQVTATLDRRIYKSVVQLPAPSKLFAMNTKSKVRRL
jgi:hypothetical protein